MIVKTRRRERSPRKVWRPSVWKIGALAGIALAVLGGVSLASVYHGMRLYKDKTADSFATFFENAVRTKLDVVPNYLSGYLRGKPERLRIDIKHRHLQKLAYKRDVAQKTGVLLTSDADYVPAELSLGDKVVRVKLRLKGDWVDHLQGDKWSFRVKVRDDETLFGINKFSLHHPKTRNFVHEWLYHEGLRREGLVALRYKFVDVTLNGKALGVYALEEHFDKRLVENNGHREGPILKFDESVHWVDLARHGGKSEVTGLQDEQVSQVAAFRMGKARQNPTEWDKMDRALTLLEAFRSGELSVIEAFDADKLATFFAFSDLMGANHATGWINVRLYYNPITSRLEPIGFDALAGLELENLAGSNRSVTPVPGRFKDLCFSDREFFGKYVSALERVSADGYLEAMLAELRGGLHENLRILYREFPYLYFDSRVYHENREAIRIALNPSKAIHGYDAGSSSERVAVEIANIQALPVEIVGLVARDSSTTRAIRSEQRVVLPSRVAGSLPDYTTVTFPTGEEFPWTDAPGVEIGVRWRLYGSNEEHTTPINPWTRRSVRLLEDDLVREPGNLDAFACFEVDESTRTVRFRSGTWEIRENVVIPGGYRVVGGEGVELDLKDRAAILSRSPVELRGSADHPITIHSSDGTGAGVIVLDAGDRSVLSHVRFRNLSNPYGVGWGITGAVTFYESPVDIEDCEFSDNRCEDALNLVRSDFRIERSLFQRTFSDAFDSDFSNGTLSHSAFLDCGNDGVDVSGSDVSLDHIVVRGAGDKGLSAGEASRMKFRDVSIERANIGVAAKDRCDVKGQGVSVVASNVGFAVFQKKSEFGPASMNVRTTSLVEVETPYLVEDGSTLIADGEIVKPNRTRLKEALYGGEIASN